MQALEREIMSNNWITILFVLGILIMALLKLHKAEKLKGYAFSVFNKGFIEIESEEKSNNFSLFHIAFTGFSFISISLAFFFVLVYYSEEIQLSFMNYSFFSLHILAYMLGRSLLESLIMRLLSIKEVLSHFFVSKRSYLYSISVGLFFLNVFYYYGFQKETIFMIGIILLFATRLTLILINNKNLIIKELFYFILYLCAFEIAPLLILYKLIFN